MRVLSVGQSLSGQVIPSRLLMLSAGLGPLSVNPCSHLCSLFCFLDFKSCISIMLWEPRAGSSCDISRVSELKQAAGTAESSSEESSDETSSEDELAAPAVQVTSAAQSPCP